MRDPAMLRGNCMAIYKREAGVQVLLSEHVVPLVCRTDVLEHCRWTAGILRG
jgi:hypothetical protein